MQQQTKDFLIRGMPINLYNLLTQSAQEHLRSKTQEAIVALRNGLVPAPNALKKPTPFKWGKKITNKAIKDAIDEGRE